MVTIEFDKFEHIPEYKENIYILGELIADFMLEFIDNEISHISENELLEYLGVPQKKIDFNNVVVYDMKILRKMLKNVETHILYDAVTKHLSQIDLCKIPVVHK